MSGVVCVTTTKAEESFEMYKRLRLGVGGVAMCALSDSPSRIGINYCRFLCADYFFVRRCDFENVEW